LATDLRWWHSTLGSWTGKLLLTPREWEDVGLYTDASGAQGAGAFFGTRWWCARWSAAFRGLNNDGHDIFWKEMFAIWVSLELWAPALTGHRIILHCDNQPCVESLNNGRAPGHPRVNDLLRRIVLLRHGQHVEILARYVPSALNPLMLFPVLLTSPLTHMTHFHIR
jgi:hypothetical protein